jgi:hypothetical protein
MVAFRARADFHFRPGNVSSAPAQQGRAGETCYSSVADFVNQALHHHGDMFKVTDKAASLRCLPKAQWRRRDFRDRRVLFLLPPPALGEHVATLLFLRSFREQKKPRAIGVFCTASATDIYMSDPPDVVYSLWIGRRDLDNWDFIVDLNHLEERRDIDTWPVDMETSLLSAFDLDPANAYPSQARSLSSAGDRLKIGILPLASSPLRTIPAETTTALIETLGADHDITLCLNRNQQQGRLYRDALSPAVVAGIRLVDAFDSIAALMQAIADFDYAVFADSGPAHMSKLSALPGTAVYTSAPAEVLQGRFDNLAAWQSPFEGPYCKAPCGLAKLRASEDGRLGCMGSLETSLEALPGTAGGRDAAVIEALLNDPVPCVALLRERADELSAFVLADIARRRLS